MNCIKTHNQCINTVVFPGASSASTYSRNSFDRNLNTKLIFIPFERKNCAGCTCVSTAPSSIPAIISINKSSAGLFCIHFHGNACDVSQISMCAWREAHAFSSHYLIVEYPRYGIGDGHPSEELLNEVAQSVHNFVVNELKVPPSQIVLIGRSIGTGPACHLASSLELRGQRPAALILQSPYTSLRDAAWDLLGCFSNCMLDRWQNWRLLIGDNPEVIRAPVLFIHADCDRIIDCSHSRLMHEFRQRSPDALPSELFIQQSCEDFTKGHNFFDYEQDMVLPCRAFLARHDLIFSPRSPSPENLAHELQSPRNSDHHYQQGPIYRGFETSSQAQQKRPRQPLVPIPIPVTVLRRFAVPPHQRHLDLGLAREDHEQVGLSRGPDSPNPNACPRTSSDLSFVIDRSGGSDGGHKESADGAGGGYVVDPNRERAHSPSSPPSAESSNSCSSSSSNFSNSGSNSSSSRSNGGGKFAFVRSSLALARGQNSTVLEPTASAHSVSVDRSAGKCPTSSFAAQSMATFETARNKKCPRFLGAGSTAGLGWGAKYVKGHCCERCVPTKCDASVTVGWMLCPCVFCLEAGMALTGELAMQCFRCTCRPILQSDTFGLACSTCYRGSSQCSCSWCGSKQQSLGSMSWSLGKHNPVEVLSPCTDYSSDSSSERGGNRRGSSSGGGGSSPVLGAQQEREGRASREGAGRGRLRRTDYSYEFNYRALRPAGNFEGNLFHLFSPSHNVNNISSSRQPTSELSYHKTAYARKAALFSFQEKPGDAAPTAAPAATTPPPPATITTATVPPSQQASSQPENTFSSSSSFSSSGGSSEEGSRGATVNVGDIYPSPEISPTASALGNQQKQQQQQQQNGVYTSSHPVRVIGTETQEGEVRKSAHTISDFWVESEGLATRNSSEIKLPSFLQFSRSGSQDGRNNNSSHTKTHSLNRNLYTRKSDPNQYNIHGESSSSHYQHHQRGSRSAGTSGTDADGGSLGKRGMWTGSVAGKNGGVGEGVGVGDELLSRSLSASMCSLESDNPIISLSGHDMAGGSSSIIMMGVDTLSAGGSMKASRGGIKGGAGRETGKRKGRAPPPRPAALALALAPSDSSDAPPADAAASAALPVTTPPVTGVNGASSRPGVIHASSESLSRTVTATAAAAAAVTTERDAQEREREMGGVREMRETKDTREGEAWKDREERKHSNTNTDAERDRKSRASSALRDEEDDDQDIDQ